MSASEQDVSLQIDKKLATQALEKQTSQVKAALKKTVIILGTYHWDINPYLYLEQWNEKLHKSGVPTAVGHEGNTVDILEMKKSVMVKELLISIAAKIIVNYDKGNNIFQCNSSKIEIIKLIMEDKFANNETKAVAMANLFLDTTQVFAKRVSHCAINNFTPGIKQNIELYTKLLKNSIPIFSLQDTPENIDSPKRRLDDEPRRIKCMVQSAQNAIEKLAPGVVCFLVVGDTHAHRLAAHLSLLKTADLNIHAYSLVCNTIPDSILVSEPIKMAIEGAPKFADLFKDYVEDDAIIDYYHKNPIIKSYFHKDKTDIQCKELDALLDAINVSQEQHSKSPNNTKSDAAKPIDRTINGAETKEKREGEQQFDKDVSAFKRGEISNIDDAKLNIAKSIQRFFDANGTYDVILWELLKDILDLPVISNMKNKLIQECYKDQLLFIENLHHIYIKHIDEERMKKTYEYALTALSCQHKLNDKSPGVVAFKYLIKLKPHPHYHDLKLLYEASEIDTAYQGELKIGVMGENNKIVTLLKFTKNEGCSWNLKVSDDSLEIIVFEAPLNYNSLKKGQLLKNYKEEDAKLWIEFPETPVFIQNFKATPVASTSKSSSKSSAQRPQSAKPLSRTRLTSTSSRKDLLQTVKPQSTASSQPTAIKPNKTGTLNLYAHVQSRVDSGRRVSQAKSDVKLKKP